MTILTARRALPPAVGASDGSIIAAIISTETPVNDEWLPGPGSIPAIRPAVIPQATPAAAIRARNALGRKRAA